MECNSNKVVSLLKRLYCFSGRSTRKEFWLTAFVLLGVDVVACAVGALFSAIKLEFLAIPLVALILIAVAVASVANTFRRMHDLGLSGFWLCYLSFLGLPFVYFAYIMDADESAKQVIERIKGAGSPWLGWILAFLCWPVGSFFGLVLILLSPGHRADNRYGANPYAESAIA